MAEVKRSVKVLDYMEEGFALRESIKLAAGAMILNEFGPERAKRFFSKEKTDAIRAINAKYLWKAISKLLRDTSVRVTINPVPKDRKYDVSLAEVEEEQVIIGKQFAEEMLSFLEDNSVIAMEAFLSKLAYGDRTLLQDFTRLCVGWLDYLADLPKSFYDLRNEASVELAVKMLAELDDEEKDIPYVPCNCVRPGTCLVCGNSGESLAPIQ
jgi:hypothetical protein